MHPTYFPFGRSSRPVSPEMHPLAAIDLLRCPYFSPLSARGPLCLSRRLNLDMSFANRKQRASSEAPLGWKFAQEGPMQNLQRREIDRNVMPRQRRDRRVYTVHGQPESGRTRGANSGGKTDTDRNSAEKDCAAPEWPKNLNEKRACQYWWSNVEMRGR